MSDQNNQATSLVSARAADAPSEPSEQGSRLFAWLVRASQCGIKPIEQAAEVLKDYYQGVGPEPEYDQFRAADALDSQPTSFEDRPLKARVLRNELAIIIGCKDGRSGQEKADAVLHWIKAQGQHVFVPAATQPTVAAQQGSIADDAQFTTRLFAWHEKESSHEEFKSLVNYIDSRASSAPVAPIAPDSGYELVGWFAYEDESWEPAPHSDWPGAVALFRESQQEGSEAGNG
jgi:hypothetical protein